MSGSWGSLVNIVSDYGLDDRAIGVRSPAEARRTLKVNVFCAVLKKVYGPFSFVENTITGDSYLDVLTL
jgi:hypothetical protein